MRIELIKQTGSTATYPADRQHYLLEYLFAIFDCRLDFQDRRRRTATDPARMTITH